MKKDLINTDETNVKNAKRIDNVSPHAGHRERMRAKFDFDPNMNVFEDHEALEFHLSLLIPRKDTNALAHELLRKFGLLNAVLNATPRELFEVKNMTTSAAYMLASEFPMIRKALKAALVRAATKETNSPESVIMYLFPQFVGQINECVAVAYLDVNYKIIKTTFNGGMESNSVFIDIPTIVATATREGATYVLFAHNHPSGNVAPSFTDVQSTIRLHDALASVGKFLLDHVVFFNSDIFSFHNNGLLDKFDEDFCSRMKISLHENPAYKMKFLLELNEYILTPLTGKEDELTVRPKNEFFEEYIKSCNDKLFTVSPNGK